MERRHVSLLEIFRKSQFSDAFDRGLNAFPHSFSGIGDSFVRDSGASKKADAEIPAAAALPPPLHLLTYSRAECAGFRSSAPAPIGMKA